MLYILLSDRDSPEDFEILSGAQRHVLDQIVG